MFYLTRIIFDVGCLIFATDLAISQDFWMATTFSSVRPILK